MISCEQCFYFNEDFGGYYYFESDYGCYCGNPMMSDFFDARGVIYHDYFPFFPAPGCFKLNPWLAPDHMFSISLCDGKINVVNESEFLKSMKEWSGDLIEIVRG